MSIGGGIFINPGSEPVDGATAEHALANLEALCQDIRAQAPEHTARVESPDLEDQGDGRFQGHIVVSGERIEIEMPGLPLEKVWWSRFKWFTIIVPSRREVVGACAAFHRDLQSNGAALARNLRVIQRLDTKIDQLVDGGLEEELEEEEDD